MQKLTRWLATSLLMLFGLWAGLGVQPVQAGPEEVRYEVAVVQDPDGWVNARSGPSTSFSIKTKIPNGRLVMVTRWPGEAARKRLQSAEQSAALKARGIDPEDLANWRWVILLERGDPSSRAGGDWAYVHATRLKTVRKDAVTWGITRDSDGYQNLRATPDGEIVGRVRTSEAFLLLPADKPYDSLTKPGLEWVPILTRDGKQGYLSADRLDFHDPRDWQWSGDIPYVDY